MGGLTRQLSITHNLGNFLQLTDDHAPIFDAYLSRYWVAAISSYLLFTDRLSAGVGGGAQ